MSEMAENGSASEAGHESSGSFDSGSDSGSTQTATQTDSSPEPGSAASIRPVPGQPPRSAASRDNGDAKPQAKEESRYERTKREKREFRAQQEAFQRERQAFAQERAQFEESKKPKRNYTLDDLKKYRDEWAQEAEQGVPGREQLVAKADQEIAAMEAEVRASRNLVELPKYGTKEHRRIWEESEALIRKEDPEFGVQGTRIDAAMRALFQGPNAKLYLDHPYGVYAAYSEAQKELLKEDNQTLQKENQTLKQELQRITGLTSISGGVPSRIGGEPKPFASLSSAEMRKRLLAGRNRPDNSMPWL